MRKSLTFLALLFVALAQPAFGDDLFSEVTIDSVYSPSGGSKPSKPSESGRRLGGIDSLTGTLLGAGYAPKRVTDDVVTITVKRDSLTIPTLVSLKDQKLWLGMMLSKIDNPSDLPTDKLLKLLAANQENGPATFVYSRNRGRIELHLALDNRSISSELVKTKLDEMAEIAAKTTDLWQLGETPESTEPVSEKDDTTEAPQSNPAPKTPSLAGKWIAAPSDTEAFALQINDDNTFFLAYVKGSQSSKSQGKASFNGQLLVLKGNDGTNLTGTVQVNGSQFTFTPSGNGSKSFTFKKA